MPALRPVPDAPPRALGAIRVSKEREEMISPEIQRAAIEDHCARSGYVLADVVEAIDESGSQRSSPWWRKLDEAVAQVEAGRFDVIVVWKFSRAARQRLRWAVALDRVEVAGGRLESATEPLDVSTSTGRLARGMLAEFNAFEAERIGDVWREVHARRVGRGLPANGKPRFGYVNDGGMHRPDPETGPVLASLYRRYVAGESMRALVVWLNAQGYRTAAGYSRRGTGEWTTTALIRTLDTGFGAGLIMVHGVRHPGAHEPVIDLPTWEAYQAARAARVKLRRSESSQYLLSGLVRCGHVLGDGQVCGSSMSGGQTGRRRRPCFRCVAVQHRRRHPGGTVHMTIVEAAVLEWIRVLADEVDVAADAAATLNARAARRKVDADTLAREVLELDRSLARLEVNRASAPDTMPAAVYAAARDELLARRAGLEQRRLAAQVEARTAEPARTAQGLLAEWDSLSVEHRRGIIRGLIGRVEVVTGTPAQVTVVPPTWDTGVI